MFQVTIVLEIGPFERCCYSIDGGELFVLSADIWRIFNPDVFRVCYLLLMHERCCIGRWSNA